MGIGKDLLGNTSSVWAGYSDSVDDFEEYLKEKMMIVHAPQAIYFILTLLGMGISMQKFGQQKTDKYGWWEVLIGPSLLTGLLYWGGFFG